MEGDTVLVDEGVYFENLIIQKNITLTSYAIYDDLSEWTGFAGEYYINNDNISNTRIDGSNDTNGDNFQSTILINSPDDECISPIIFGFTITGGDGTRATVDDIEKTLGGGILSNNALPKINYNFITNNNGDVEGGGLDEGGALNQGSGVDLGENVLGIRSNHLRCDGDVDLSYNFYRDNDALYGNTLATVGFAGTLDMTSSIFDVYNCPEEEVTPVWVDVEEDVEVDFQYSAGDLCSITEDVWVSPDGNDYLNTGTSESSAFRTIAVALELIAPDSLNPPTINLTEGTFSPSITGEPFPIIMISNVNLIGQGEEVTILDAEQSGRVIIMINCDNNTISDLTLTGGLEGGYPNYYGGGMYLSSSNPTLTHVTIANNRTSEGGGMYLIYSNPTLNNVTISNNEANTSGGGMELYSSNPILTHVTISNNEANFGGGMYLYDSNSNLTHVTIANNTAYFGGGMYLDYTNPTLNNVTISNNEANFGGGGMSLYSSNPNLTNVTISNNMTGIDGGGMLSTSSNPILTNSIIWGNSPESINFDTGMPLITYSNIEGGWEGEENIGYEEGDDPLFNDDYTLQPDSPCIDAGTIIEDMEYCGDAPDMGAYEYCEEECGAELADVTGDGQINVLDLVQISYYVLELSTPAYPCAADYNQDGQVNILDLVQISNYILNP